jgi:hypothetical protein
MRLIWSVPMITLRTVLKPYGIMSYKRSMARVVAPIWNFVMLRRSV